MSEPYGPVTLGAAEGPAIRVADETVDSLTRFHVRGFWLGGEFYPRSGYTEDQP